MKSLKSLLDKKAKIQKTSLTEKDIFFVAGKIIQEELGTLGSENLKADFWKEGKLFIKSKNSAWGAELIMNKKRILKKINEQLGGGEVKELKLK
jgi:predicted nucleic acid-binding Zn ribbon protein